MTDLIKWAFRFHVHQDELAEMDDEDAAVLWRGQALRQNRIVAEDPQIEVTRIHRPDLPISQSAVVLVRVAGLVERAPGDPEPDRAER